MRRTIPILLASCLLLLVSNLALARGSHGGHYNGGKGSSHKGGSYKSKPTNDHYRKR